MNLPTRNDPEKRTRGKEEEIKELGRQLEQAEAIVVGAGAGLSTSAGLTYGGTRFQRLFPDFIDKYKLTDMYSAGFYPFGSQEEKWAYWSRHIDCNRYQPGACGLYKRLHEILKNKNYFVITTNVDHQFRLAGFPEERIFATQGDYGLFQCKKACHNTLYENRKQVEEMVRRQEDMRIPPELIPKCPVCGGEMEVNLRRDRYFVEDEAWHKAAARYEKFLKDTRGKRVLLLELGVGMNTPVIIKYPFWQMTAENPRAVYACVNLGEAIAPKEIAEHAVCIDGDIGEILKQLTLNKTNLTLVADVDSPVLQPCLK